MGVWEWETLLLFYFSVVKGYLSLCMCLPGDIQMYTSVQGGEKRLSGPLKLELQEVGSRAAPAWLLWFLTINLPI